MDIKKEYQYFLKDLNIKDTKENKKYFKNLVVKTYIEFFGLFNSKTLEIKKQLEEL